MKELIRVNSFIEAQDLKLFLGSEGIDCQIPDEYSLSIAGMAAFGRGTGRILVAEEDYLAALHLLKQWNSHYVTAEPVAAQRFVEHPFVVGISPRQVARGISGWKEIRFLEKVKIIGGITLMIFFTGFWAAWLWQWF
ncbi:MAG: putative signal transducing protein [Bdellovibrionota bacterium]